MLLMATSLAITASGILLAYLLLHVMPQKPAVVGGQVNVDARDEPTMASSRGGVLADNSLLEQDRVAPVSERNSRVDARRHR